MQLIYPDGGTRRLFTAAESWAGGPSRREEDPDLLMVQPRTVVDTKLVAILVLPVHYAQISWPHVCRKPPGATRPSVDLRYLKLSLVSDK
jgi:hypothetical protein